MSGWPYIKQSVKIIQLIHVTTTQTSCGDTAAQWDTLKQWRLSIMGLEIVLPQIENWGGVVISQVYGEH